MVILSKIFVIGFLLWLWGSFMGLGFNNEELKKEDPAVIFIVFFFTRLPELLGPVMMLVSIILIVIIG